MSDSNGSEQSQLNPAIKASHDVFDPVWKDLPKDQKEAIKALVTEIGKLETELGAKILASDETPPRFAEPRYVAFTSEKGQLMLPIKEGESASILWELTTRADTVEDTIHQIHILQRVALASGFIAKDTYFDERRNERQATTGHGTLTFPATELSATVMKGKPYWGIIGGRWTKPVRVWPEVLEAAGIASVNQDTGLAELDSNQVYDLTGWVCHCEVNPEKGWPSKVVKLVKS